MKKYSVSLMTEEYIEVEVVADSIEEAMQIAEEENLGYVAVDCLGR